MTNAYTLAATPAVLLTIAWPPLGLYLLGVASLVAVAAFAFAAHRFHGERDTARAEVERLGRELDAAEDTLTAERTVRRRTEAAFAEFQQSVSDAGGRVVIPLRSVPAQRDGSEYEWPAIMRAVEGEVER